MRALLLALLGGLYPCVLVSAMSYPQGDESGIVGQDLPGGEERVSGQEQAAPLEAREDSPVATQPGATEDEPEPARRGLFPVSIQRMLEGHFGTFGVFFLIALGFLFCFFGQPWLKVLLGVAGLLVGAATGYTLAVDIGLAGQLQVGASVVGGVAGAALTFFLFWLSLFLLGAGFGGVLCLLALMALGRIPATTAVFQEPFLVVRGLPLLSQLVLAGSGLAGGLITLWLRRSITVLATAFCGALLLVVNLLASTAWGRGELERLERLEPGAAVEFHWDALLLLGAWLTLGLLGALFQFRMLARRQPEPKGPPAAAPAAPSGKVGPAS